MGLYSLLTTGVNLSQLITQLELRHQAMRSHERGTSTPTVLEIGALWERTDYPTIGNALMRYNGSSYAFLLDPDFGQINAGGTVPYAANQAMGSNKFTGLAAGSGAGDSVRYEQVLLLSGGTMTGMINTGGNRVTNLPGPADGTDAARAFYVDARAGQVGTVSWDPSLVSGAVTTGAGAGTGPQAVLACIELMNPTTPAPGTSPVSTNVLFVAGTGTESGRVFYGGLNTPWTTPTWETLNCTFNATGFVLQVGSTSWRHVKARYRVWL
jgi:hypothetical protein